MEIFKSKKTIIIIIVCLLAAGYGWIFLSSNGEDSTPVLVDTEYTVKTGDVRIDYAGDGEVELSTINLDFEVSGTVSELVISEGDWIEEGISIAKLDDADYQTDYLKALNSYDEALLNYEQTLAQDNLDRLSRTETLKNLAIDLENAKTEYDRNLKLEGVISQKDLEDSETDYNKALNGYNTQVSYNSISSNDTKKVELAEMAIESAKLNLIEAEENLNDTELISPSSGKVLSINFSEGESFTSPSNNTSTDHFMVLLDSSEVEVISPISEIDIESVFEDQDVEIIFEAYPSKVYHGVVTRIADIPTSSSGLVTYDAVIEMTDADESVKDGMTCEIDFILSQRKNVVVIPNKAVEYIDGNQYVVISTEGGTIEERVIKTGLTDGKNVEVTDGLTINEVIVYSVTSQE